MKIWRKKSRIISQSDSTDVCEDIVITECEDTSDFTVVLINAEGEQTCEQAEFHSEYDADIVISRYLEVNLPAGYSFEETFEMSYFLYPEYTWFVANKVNVVEKENLEAGIYLTSTESTLMFRRAQDSHLSGYGDLVKIENGEEITVTCIDAEYAGFPKSIGSPCNPSNDGDEKNRLVLSEQTKEGHSVADCSQGIDGGRRFLHL